MRATSKLRELLRTGQTLFVPGCYNALSAKPSTRWASPPCT